MEFENPTIRVVIPTFKRPESLLRCITSLFLQNVPADEILVVVQEQDDETLKIVEKLEVELRTVNLPGIIVAIQNSLTDIKTDLVAFIDDDVSLPPDWIKKAKTTFKIHSEIGALGGTDFQSDTRLKDDVKVGMFTLYGKIIGNHHLASGSKRYVDFLKGCNMVIRTSVVQNFSPIFTILRGNGAQVGNDLVLSLSSRIHGLNTLFDPDFFVYHHVEPRKESSQRNSLSDHEKLDLIFNLFLIKLTFSRNYMRPIVLFYQLFVGDRELPGLLRSLILRKLKIGIIAKDMYYLLNTVPKIWRISTIHRKPLSRLKLKN